MSKLYERVYLYKRDPRTSKVSTDVRDLDIVRNILMPLRDSANMFGIKIIAVNNLFTATSMLFDTVYYFSVYERVIDSIYIEGPDVCIYTLNATLDPESDSLIRVRIIEGKDKQSRYNLHREEFDAAWNASAKPILCEHCPVSHTFDAPDDALSLTQFQETERHAVNTGSRRSYGS